MNELYKTRTIKESKTYKFYGSCTRFTLVVINERDGVFYVNKMGESYTSDIENESERLHKFSRSISKTFTSKQEALKFYNK